MRITVATLVMIVCLSIPGCSSFRTPEAGVPSISGKWRIEQTNAGGPEFTGTLILDQHGSGFSGSVTWDNHGKAKIVNGTVSRGASTGQGSIISFVIEYDGGLKGKYYATLNASGKMLVDGATIAIQGSSDMGVWNARLIEE